MLPKVGNVSNPCIYCVYSTFLNFVTVLPQHFLYRETISVRYIHTFYFSIGVNLCW
nr:MAG TPA: hypothetical protein [Caudoviricetes sp.]